MRSHRWGAVLAGAVAAVSAATLMAVGRDRPRTAGLSWQRVNHAGRTVTLWEGPSLAVGAGLGAAVGGSWAGALACLGSSAFGALDDHVGDSSSKGLRGHLGALARGDVTTGAVKIIGLGATGLLAATLADRSAGRPVTASTVVGAALVAGAANLGNLLDLRPGRALKTTTLTALPLLPGAGAVPAAAAIGAAAGVIATDLRGESMLGDTGANAAGALVGIAAVERLGPRGRLLALTVVTALTIASERVSFTTIIESTPVLRELDQWGRPR